MSCWRTLLLWDALIIFGLLPAAAGLFVFGEFVSDRVEECHGFGFHHAYVAVFLLHSVGLAIGLLLREVFAFLELDLLAKYSPSVMALVAMAGCVLMVFMFGSWTIRVFRRGRVRVAALTGVAVLPIVFLPAAHVYWAPDSLQSLVFMTFVGFIPAWFAAALGVSAHRARQTFGAYLLYLLALFLSPLGIVYYLWSSKAYS